MSLAKKMCLLSIVPAVLLVSCAIGTIGKSGEQVSFSTVDTDREPASASRKLRLLTEKEIQQMPAKKVYDYYSKLYSFLNEMERFQSQTKNYNPRKKSAAIFQFIEESFAGTETPSPYTLGNDCLIGGYWGTWIKKSITSSSGATTYRMTCDSPNRCTVPGASVQNSGHKCNPKFFTYMDADANPPKEFCADLRKDLTTSNCRTVIENFYNEQGKDSFADHFKRGLLKAVAADPKYNGSTQAYVDEVNAEYARIFDYCGPTEADWNKHTAGQNYSCFPLMQQYSEIDAALRDISQDPAPAQAPAPSPAPAAPRAYATGGGLGPFACIQAGLKKTGHPGVSDKYIAMLAVAAKYRSDTRFALFENRTKRAIATVISTLTDIGLCKSRLYDFTGNEASTSEQILNTPRYGKNGISPAQYEAFYGYPWSPIPDNKPWENMTAPQRLASWNSAQPIRPVQSCVASSHYRIEKKDCIQMYKSCQVNTAPCYDRPERDTSGSDHSGNNNGSHSGGSSTGSTNGATNGSTNAGSNNNGGRGEVGNGSNAESGHGSDNGAGMGSGPPGS